VHFECDFIEATNLYFTLSHGGTMILRFFLGHTSA
jgi:hypothetical protein